MSLSKFQLEALLLQASNAQYGILVSTNNPDRLRQKLYPIKKLSPEFKFLAFIISPANPGGHLLIVKKAETPDVNT